MTIATFRVLRAWLGVVGLGLAGCGGADGDADEATATAGSSTGGGACEVGGGEASVGPCLVAAHAGTYAVTGGAHSRGSITLGADGSVDYDAGLLFGIGDYEGVYDRLECCQRISVEMKQRPDNDKTLAPDARHRVDIFTDSTSPGGAVVRFEYFPNWPSEAGKVMLDVTG